MHHLTDHAPQTGESAGAGAGSEGEEEAEGHGGGGHRTRLPWVLLSPFCPLQVAGFRKTPVPIKELDIYMHTYIYVYIFIYIYTYFFTHTVLCICLYEYETPVTPVLPWKVPSVQGTAPAFSVSVSVCLGSPIL